MNYDGYEEEFADRMDNGAVSPCPTIRDLILIGSIITLIVRWLV